MNYGFNSSCQLSSPLFLTSSSLELLTSTQGLSLVRHQGEYFKPKYNLTLRNEVTFPYFCFLLSLYKGSLLIRILLTCTIQNAKAAKTTLLMVCALLLCYLPLVIKWNLCWVKSPAFSILAQVKEELTASLFDLFLFVGSCVNKQFHESFHLCSSCSSIQIVADVWL